MQPQICGITQLVQRPTEKPGAILTRVRVPGAAREFSLTESTSSADSLTGVCTALVCNRMHQQLCRARY